MSKTITVTFKESEKELCDKFKKKYSSPGAIIKDFIKQDLEENKKGRQHNQVQICHDFKYLDSRYAYRLVQYIQDNN